MFLSAWLPIANCLPRCFSLRARNTRGTCYGGFVVETIEFTAAVSGALFHALLATMASCLKTPWLYCHTVSFYSCSLLEVRQGMAAAHSQSQPSLHHPFYIIRFRIVYEYV